MNMKKNYFWPRFVLAAIIAVALSWATLPAGAQEGAAGSGKIHGQVTDPAGAPVENGTVS